MQRLAVLLLCAFAASAFTSCQNPILQAGDEADRVVEKVDQAIEKSEQRVERLLQKATEEIEETTKQLRDTYSESLQETSGEVSKLREEFNRDVTALEGKLEERITQVETSALKVIREGDSAAQARIDQVFTELRTFVKETLAQIKDLIGPVLSMAENVSSAASAGQEHFATVVKKILELVDKVQGTLTDLQESVRKFSGRDSKTGEPLDGGGWPALITGILAALLAGWTQWQRKRDRGKDGERWKPEELKAKTRADVSEAIKLGEFDDELRGRLVALGMISTKPNGGEKS